MADPLLYATVLFPLIASGQNVAPGDWRAGAWPHPGTDNREYDATTRTAPYLNPEPIRRLITQPRRRWRPVGVDLAVGVHCPVTEIARVDPPTDHAPAAYGLIHLEIAAGPRGGLSEQLQLLAELARPRRQRASETVVSLFPGWRADERVPRAVVTALITDASAHPPLLPSCTDSLDAWLHVLTALPTDTIPRGAIVTGERLVAAGLAAHVAPHGVAIVPPPGWRSYVGEIRGQLVDAMLLAVLQRDWLLGFARELADGEAWDRNVALRMAGRFDEFRRQWWWQFVSDLDRVGTIFTTWQAVSGAAGLMHQLIAEVGDLRTEQRARSTERIARWSIGIAAASFVMAALSVVVSKWT